MSFTLDTNKFKEINDSFGHEAGDHVLRQVTVIFTQCLRDVDIAGRLGGDEFGVLLPNTALDDALALAERLRQMMARQEIEVRGTQVQYTMSFGVAEIDAEMNNIDDLFRKADMALYQDKNSGRERLLREVKDAGRET